MSALNVSDAERTADDLVHSVLVRAEEESLTEDQITRLLLTIAVRFGENALAGWL